MTASYRRSQSALRLSSNRMRTACATELPKSLKAASSNGLGGRLLTTFYSLLGRALLGRGCLSNTSRRKV